jgi:hypothetical protein
MIGSWSRDQEDSWCKMKLQSHCCTFLQDMGCNKLLLESRHRDPRHRKCKCLLQLKDCTFQMDNLNILLSLKNLNTDPLHKSCKLKQQLDWSIQLGMPNKLRPQLHLRTFLQNTENMQQLLQCCKFPPDNTCKLKMLVQNIIQFGNLYRWMQQDYFQIFLLGSLYRRLLQLLHIGQLDMQCRIQRLENLNIQQGSSGKMKIL